VRELSLHLLDIIGNSLEAGASLIEIEIVEDVNRNLLAIKVTDNGRGMDQETLRRVGDPFFTTRTTRPVGLGIALFRAAAQRCNGDLAISSQLGTGTQVTASFQLDHIDRAPLGDLRTTLLTLVLYHEQCALAYLHRVNGREFQFDTRIMREILGDLPLSHPRVRAWLEEFLDEGLADLYARPKR
jgi:hypothetical protein